MDAGFRGTLEKARLSINTPDTQPFRARLASAGYYASGEAALRGEGLGAAGAGGRRDAGLNVRHVERALGATVEAAAALLVVIEILTLFASVVARYAFRAPIVWSDEFAGAVFLWLAMLGAAIALRRGEHIRFTGLLARLPPAWRRRTELLAVLLAMVMLALLLQPALDYVQDESYATMPNLGIPDSWRVLAVLVGLVLMLLLAVLQTLRGATWREGARDAAIVLPPLAAMSAALVLLAPSLVAIGNANLLVFFVALIGVCVAAGLPIGFSFGLATTAYLGLTTTVPLSVVLNRLDQGMSQPVLLAVPMFIFLGLLIELTGLARAMVAFLAALLGTVRGGLDYVLLAAMMLVSGISGSKAADMAAVAPALFPEMRARGMREGEMVALLSSSAAMADTIPPSLVLITFGSVTGISIAALFTAGLIPAVLLAAALAGVTAVRVRGEPAAGRARSSGRWSGAPSCGLCRLCCCPSRSARRWWRAWRRRRRCPPWAWPTRCSPVRCSTARWRGGGSCQPWWRRRRCRVRSCS